VGGIFYYGVKMKLEKVYKVVSHKMGVLPIQANGATFRPAGVKRKSHAGDVPENSGFTESPALASSKLKLNAAFKEDITLLNLAKNDADTLTIYATNGNQYLMKNAWAVEPGELGDGEVAIEYNSAESPCLGQFPENG
jgi:hypothetical protein